MREEYTFDWLQSKVFLAYYVHCLNLLSEASH